jgi:16S rRNA (cytosine967-C5)-methyltransferase
MQAFDALWRALFTTPVHLDSAIAKLPPTDRAALAFIVPKILRRPTSLARTFDVSMGEGEPWSLSQEALSDWAPARAIAQAMLAKKRRRGAHEHPFAVEDFPPCVIEEIAALGEDRSNDVLASLSEEPPLTLRGARRIGADALIERLRSDDERLRVERSTISPLAVRLLEYRAVTRHPAFAEGAFEIQDEGSQMMALFVLWPDVYRSLLSDRPGAVTGVHPALPPTKHQRFICIDACAGAGGKTLAIADALGGRNRVFAYDVSSRRIEALKKRAQRAGAHNVQAVAVEPGREGEIVERFAKSAHAVLVDAPCSGWGVLRRSPDVKWRIEPDALLRLPRVQKKLLDTYAPLVAPGGRLTYGVCTFRRSETIEVAEAFAGADGGFRPTAGGFLGPGPSDGFFMQSFERVG